MSEYHIPVLLEESTLALISDKSGVYVDATFGGGGHSSKILSTLDDNGRLIAFDKDADALDNVLDDKRFTLIHNNFRFIYNYLLYEGFKDGVDGIIADLGVSSHQFDTPGRGFSFRYNAPLDMRMNNNAERSATDVVNQYEEDELERIFRLYGEVENSGKAARLVCAARKKAPIKTTEDFNAAIADILPKSSQHKYLAKIYQALRIEVNQEMRSLEKFLEGAVASLKPGGRLVVITYHSLEDRMVKNYMRSGNVDGVLAKDLFGRSSSPFTLVFKKPVLPSETEIASNTRARSAKLRVAEKRRTN